MQALVIDETEFTPHICFNCQENTLLLKGNSYPEDPLTFYALVFEWLDQYLAQVKPDSLVKVNAEIAYFNSSSSRVLLKFFKILNDKAFDDVIPIDINWFYDPEDLDLLEYGQDFQLDYRALKFNFIEKRDV